MKIDDPRDWICPACEIVDQWQHQLCPVCNMIFAPWVKFQSQLKSTAYPETVRIIA
jgi:hypothetical protein